MKFEVSVEKRLYVSGTIGIDCSSQEEAIELIQQQIDDGNLQTTEIGWDIAQYEDCSFTTTGDVDAVF